MANGVSCAFFAGKNLIYGQKEGNLFKEGIGVIQTTRTIDSAAQAGYITGSWTNGLNKIAKFARKLLYPLIILSGVYNTIKSNDKVKTGAQQAGGISCMYSFEKIAEKGLVKMEKKLLSLPKVQANKKLAFGVYVLKGLGFVCASLLGYKTGNAIGGKIVDLTRHNDNSTKYLYTGIDFTNNMTEDVFEDIRAK